MGCRCTSGSWTSTHFKEKAPNPLTQTGLRKLFAALRRKRPVSKSRFCIHFTCLRQSLRFVLPAADTSTLAGAAANVYSAWFILLLPCVITALRFNSAAGTSDSSAFYNQTATQCTEQGTVLFLIVLTRERLLQIRCLGFCPVADRRTSSHFGTELWDVRRLCRWDVSWAQNVTTADYCWVGCMHQRWAFKWQREAYIIYFITDKSTWVIDNHHLIMSSTTFTDSHRLL